jgi:Zeta toxin
MAPDQGSALSADLQRVFERQIRPDLLDAVSPATSPPAAFLIDGAPGAGVATTMAQLRRQMGPSVGISVDTLRQYHRPLRTPGTQRTADTEQADVARWYAHLIAETMRKRCNLIVDLSLAKGPATTALADSMKRASYDVTAVVLATGRDQNRQAALAAYDLCQCSGLAVRLDPALLRDTGERLVRDTLQRLESTASVDRLQLLDGNGREIYQNHRTASGWAHAPRALAVFDDVALHRPSPEALADSALRWLTLAQRLASNPAVPREVASGTPCRKRSASATALDVGSRSRGLQDAQSPPVPARVSAARQSGATAGRGRRVCRARVRASVRTRALHPADVPARGRTAGRRTAGPDAGARRAVSIGHRPI